MDDCLERSMKKRVYNLWRVHHLWIDTPGGGENFVVHMSAVKGEGICFTSGSLDFSVRDFQQTVNLHFRDAMCLVGICLRRLAHSYGVIWFPWYSNLGISCFDGPKVHVKPFAILSDTSSVLIELSLVELADGENEGCPLSSLHVLPLWMINDKLDVFDNKDRICFTLACLGYPSRGFHLTVNLQFRGTSLGRQGNACGAMTIGLCCNLGIWSFDCPKDPAERSALLPDRLSILGESPLVEIDDEEDEGGRPWSSLPVLVLWMVKDRLDIFDSWRIAGVCRDWRSASAGYPKSLQTVGDGLPWIWDMGSNNPGQEFVSVERGCKLRIDMPELVGSWQVLYSKQGWILLRKRGRVICRYPLERMPEDSLILVNPLTRAKIELPILEGAPSGAIGCYGSFTTSTDGHPHRVFIHMLKSPRIVILTARPGEQQWTEHVFLDRAITMLGIKALTAIGHKLYCDAASAGLIIFDLENHSWKEVAPLAQKVYYAELDGQLLCLPLRDRRYKTYQVYKYNDAPTSWEKLKDSEARGINWYMFDASSCIATKRGEGQMIYNLYRIDVPRGRVYVQNLKAGGIPQLLSLPFEITSKSYWVHIG